MGRRWGLVALMLCGCHKLFSLGVLDDPPPSDAADAQAPDGAEPTLAKWATTTALPSGRDYNHRHAAFIADTLYLIGGYDVMAGIETDVVYRATSTAGELGAWTTTAPLPAPRALGDIATIGSWIYVVGGANFGAAQQTVYVGQPDTAGNIPSWFAEAELPAPRKAHAVAAAGNFLYVVGGADTGNARLTTVFYAPVAQDGDLSSWQSTTALPAPRANHGSVAARGFLYAIGGDDSDTTIHATVYVAAIDASSGQLGPWTPTTPLPVERRGLVAVTDGSYIYVIGGASTLSTSEVRYSRIADDGTLGPWLTSEPLLIQRYRHAAVLANGLLFVIGGSQASTSVEHSSQGG